MNKWPFNRQNAPGRGAVNPSPSMSAEQYGRTIDRSPRNDDAGGGAGGDMDWPLKLVKVDDENVKVLLGTVSGFTPVNVNTNIDLSGTDGTWTVYMHATISGTAVASVEVLWAIAPFFFDTGNNSYRLIGEVDVDTSVITAVRPAMAWSQTIITCTDDSTPHDWLTGA